MNKQNLVKWYERNIYQIIEIQVTNKIYLTKDR